MDNLPVQIRCPNCASLIPPESAFCNHCGHKIADITVDSINVRLSKLEHRQRQAIKQDYLEVDTAAKVAERVKSWAKTWLFWTGISLGILVLALGVIWGKGVFDLRKVASGSKEEVEAILEQARGAARDAKATADDALIKSKQMSAELKETQAKVDTLSGQVKSQLVEVEKLGVNIKGSQAQVEGLKNSLDTQTKAVRYLSDEVTAVKNAKNTAAVLNSFPILGKHWVGGGAGGPIDPNQKIAGKTYAVLTLSVPPNPTFKPAPEAVGEVQTALENSGYNVFFESVSLYAGSPTTSSQGLVSINSSACFSWSRPISIPPCILYFQPQMRASALKARELVKPIQDVQDAKIVYVDPATLANDQRELLTMSHMDIVIVLGQP